MSALLNLLVLCVFLSPFIVVAETLYRGSNGTVPYVRHILSAHTHLPRTKGSSGDHVAPWHPHSQRQRTGSTGSSQRWRRRSFRILPSSSPRASSKPMAQRRSPIGGLSGRIWTTLYGESRHLESGGRFQLAGGGLSHAHALSVEGSDHYLASTVSGKVYSWMTDIGTRRRKGKPVEEELLLGRSGSAHKATAVELPEDAFIVAVSAGGDHSLALTRHGQVYTWGDNVHGQLGRQGEKEADVSTLAPAPPKQWWHIMGKEDGEDAPLLDSETPPPPAVILQ
ncbi:hypothetical protein CYMTET_30462, partial [Cymbomonas tetramitiformis]